MTGAAPGDAGPGGEDRGGPVPLGPSLLACALAALWVDFGVIHRHHYGDSVIPILVSLQRWTPYYWDQDRYGMLVPLLAIPIRDPLANLLAQMFVGVACGLSALFLLPRFFRADPTASLAGTAVAASFLALAPTAYQFTFLGTDQPYHVSMALGLGGLILAEPGGPRFRARLAAALAMIGLAFWVNFAVILVLGPLAAFRFVLSDATRDSFRLPPIPRDRAGLVASIRWAAGSRFLVSMGLLGVGFGFGRGLMGLVGRAHTTFRTRPTAEWAAGGLALARNAWLALAPGTWPIALASAAGLGLVASIVLGRSRAARPAWRAASALAGTGLVMVAYLGTTRWAEINASSHRYVLPAVLAISAGLATVAVAPIASRLGPRARRLVPVAGVPALLLGAAIGHGPPALSTARRALDGATGSRTADLLANGCTHVAGDYFAVWPSVFHANLTLRERDESRSVYGITFRSWPTRRYWKRTPRAEIRVGVALGDTLAEGWLASSLFPEMEEAGRTGTIRVLRPVPPPTDGRRDWPPW